MPEPMLITAILCIPLVGALALRYADAFAIPEEAGLIRLQRRLRRERRPSVSGRLQRGSLVRRLDEARDLRRLLITAGKDMTPGTWGLRVIATMLTVIAAAVAIDGAGIVLGDGPPLNWSLVLLLVVATPLAAVLRLRLASLRQRENAGRAFGELAAVLAASGGRPPLRNPASIEATDLVAMVGSWIDDPSLRTITADNRWRRLAEDASGGNGAALVPASESDWFRVVGELYSIPAAARVGEVVRISRELNAGDVAARYLLTARDLSRERLASLRARNRRAMVTQVVPMIGLVAALMILVLSAVAAIHLGGN